MATLNLTGFETGDNSEGTLAGTASIQSTTVRTGAYALQCNPTTTGTGSYTLQGITAATGLTGTFSAATLYSRFYFRFATAPASGDEEIFVARGTAGAQKLSLRLTSALKLAAYDTTPTIISTGATVLSANTWYRIEVQSGTGTAAWAVKIDGNAEINATTAQGATNHGSIGLGKRTDRNGQTVNFFFDDVLLSDSALPGAGECHVMTPNAAGNAQTWTRGGPDSGANWDQVDEVPPVSTDYLVSTLSIGDAETEGMNSATYSGISGTIASAKPLIRAIRDSSVNGAITMRARAGSTNSDAASNAAITTANQTVAQILDTNPATSLAWTAGGLDGLEVGAVEQSNAANSASRMFSACAMVDCVPIAPVADFTGNPLSGGATLTVAFVDATANGPASWLWEKNDGSGWVSFAATPTVRNPMEAFAAGTWSVRVTATNSAGTDTKTRTNYVIVSVGGAPAARAVLGLPRQIRRPRRVR